MRSSGTDHGPSTSTLAGALNVDQSNLRTSIFTLGARHLFF